MKLKKYSIYFFLFVFVLSAAGMTVSAERNNTVGFSAGLIASADDRPYISGFNLGADSDDYFFTGSFYPRMVLNSMGPASLFSLSYGFGMNRVNSDLDLNTESHEIGLAWDTAIGERGSFRLSNNFRKSPDFDTFTLFRGIVEGPEGYFFDFDTVAEQRDSYWNDTSASLGVALGERSDLNFSGGISFRKFDDLPGFRNEDQFRTFAGLEYSRDISEHTSWNLGYDIRYFDFYGGESSAFSHNVGLGIHHMFSPTLSMDLSAGPAYVMHNQGVEQFENKTGYNAGFSLNKRIEKHLFSLNYNERSAATYGTGGLAKTRDAGLAYSREFERVLVNASVRYFNTESIYESGYSYEGVFSMLSFGLKLTRNLMFEVGGSYRKQDSDDYPGVSSYAEYERKRVYVSFRFNFPELWRISG